ncbi:phosphotransferase family protein [Mumia sp. DW29H23]|uniref:phosphotransferase family protein n=1 Tax=Mumia sp. DW29H23 TaxID=3421241 RepID=UPI003D68BF62
MEESGGVDHRVRRTERGTLLRRRLPEADCLTSEHEAALLRVVAAVSPLAVPTVVEVWPDEDVMEMAALPGGPLLPRLDALDAPVRDGIATDLGSFLAALHEVPPETVADLVPVDDTPLGELRDEAAGTLDVVDGTLTADQRRTVERFVEAPAPPAAPRLVLSHNDLGAEHVFVDADPRVITGIIDWSDAALTDPALDLGLVLRDLGRRSFEHALAAYGSGGADEGLRERAVFHARARALEDLAYGLESGRDDYRRNALRAIAELFADAAEPDAAP